MIPISEKKFSIFKEVNDFDVCSDHLIGQFIDKEVSYELLREAKQKVEEYIIIATMNKSERNIIVIKILTKLIGLMDIDVPKTTEGKKKK